MTNDHARGRTLDHGTQYIHDQWTMHKVEHWIMGHSIYMTMYEVEHWIMGHSIHDHARGRTLDHGPIWKFKDTRCSSCDSCDHEFDFASVSKCPGYF